MASKFALFKSQKTAASRKDAEVPAEFLRTVMDTVLDGLAVLNAQGVIHSFNPAAERIFGYHPDEVIGKNIKILIPALSHSEQNGYLNNYLTTGKKRGIGLGREVMGKRKDGAIFPMELGVGETRLDGAHMFVVTMRNVTERKAMENAVRYDSERRLNFVLETARMGAWELNVKDHTSAYRSPVHDLIFGYAEPLLEWTYEMFLDHVVPEDRPLVESNFRFALENESDCGFECRIRRADGQIRWIWAKGQHHFDSTGIVPCMSGIVQDITERKQTEYSLKESQIYLDTIIEMMPSMVFVKEAEELRFVRFNKAGEELTGLSRNQLLGKNDYNFFPVEQADEFIRIDREVLARGKLKIVEQEELDTPLGKKVLRTKKVPITLPNNKQYLLGISEDITKLKEAELQLIESEKFQRLITDSNPDFIIVKDQEFKIVYANEAFLNAYPLDKRDKVIGYTTVEEYDPEEAELFLAMDRKAFSEGFSETTESIAFPNGETITLYTQKILFHNSRNEPFILVLARDITEHENLIERLNRSNAELERFAYVASHDMQEPLRMITSFGEIILNDYADKLDDEGKEYLKLVVDSGVRMRSMVDDLLEYSRVGGHDIHFMDFNGTDALAEALKNLKGLIHEKKADLTHDTLPELQGNPIQFMRLLQNLLANAIKYQPAGNIPRVHVSVEDQGKYWCISVKDNGLGIKEEFLHQVFQPFRRLHSYRDVKGTGLGLAICKKIVECHGGTIQVTSVPKKGSVFSFTIAKRLVPNRRLHDH